MIRVESRQQHIPSRRRQNRQAAIAYQVLFSSGGYRPTPPNPNVVAYVKPSFYEDHRREELAVLPRRVVVPMALFVVPNTSVVPALIGLDAQAALSALANVSLSGTISQQDLSLNVKYNVVFSQSIPAGTQVGQGTIVNLVVQDLTVVPNVLLRSQSDAQAIINAAFLTSTVVKKVAAFIPGIVFLQDPIAGTGLPANSVVTITVAIKGDGFRCQAVSPGWYGGTFYNIGDVFDILQASDFSDYTLNYEVAGAEYASGWMMQVPSTTPLTQPDGSGFLTTANRRFVE